MGAGRLELLARPAFTGAVATLALNDRVLKGHWPGWITGKLSDAAGVFALALLISALTCRPRLAAILTTAGFTAIKLWPEAASLAAPFLGGVTRQDPTDLLALPVVAVAYTIARSSISSTEPGFGPLILIVAAALGAAVTMGATSCAAVAEVDRLLVDGPTVFARIADDEHIGNEAQPVYEWARSDDGGRNWRRADSPPGVADSATRACAANGLCYRLVDGRRVDERPPGRPWHESFAFTNDERRRINARTGCRAVSLFQSIAVLERSGVSHTVVAMGSQGVLHRRGTEGWERRGVLDRKPISLFGPSWVVRLVGAPLLLLITAPVAYLICRARRRARAGEALFGTLILGLAVMMGMGFASFAGIDYMLTGPASVILTVVVFGWSVREARRPQRTTGGIP